jgi:hypothetical protein
MHNAMRALAGDIATGRQIAALTGRADEIEHVEWDLALEIAESGDDVTFGCVGDFCTVVDSVERMADDPYMGVEPEEAYELIFWETVAEVRRLWPEITTVAEALRARKALSGDEVSRLIESARRGEG